MRSNKISNLSDIEFNNFRRRTINGGGFTISPDTVGGFTGATEAAPLIITIIELPAKSILQDLYFNTITTQTITYKVLLRAQGQADQYLLGASDSYSSTGRGVGTTRIYTAGATVTSYAARVPMALLIEFSSAITTFHTEVFFTGFSTIEDNGLPFKRVETYAEYLMKKDAADRT